MTFIITFRGKRYRWRGWCRRPERRDKCGAKVIRLDEYRARKAIARSGGRPKALHGDDTGGAA